MAQFTVQRKITAWESQTIEADSFEDAIEKAEDRYHAYYTITETFEPTGDYWVRDNDTLEDRTDF